ncbi:MAG TPA: response regulator [Aggregatilineales bacterium]|nr:response regulator [Aggregatilineales bacterium]
MTMEDPTQPSKPSGQHDPLDGLHTLVVEDNALNEATIAVMLDHHKVHCQFVRTGFGVVQAALDMGRVDVILLDIGLPHHDGYEVLKDIRAEPRLAGVKVIAVTARDPRIEMERTRAAGFDGYISKPLRHNQLPDQLRRIARGEAVWDDGV